MEPFKLKCGLIDHNRRDYFEKRSVNSNVKIQKIQKNCFTNTGSNNDVKHWVLKRISRRVERYGI